MNIYIGNFSYETSEEELRAVFEPFGSVERAKIIKDKFTGESKGFGFVVMPSNKEAQLAIEGIKEIDGKTISINEARPQVRQNTSRGRDSFSRGRNNNRRDQRGY